jgi:hypothetical protein
MKNEEEDIAALRKFVRDNRKHLSRVKSGLEDLNVAANHLEGTVDKFVSDKKPHSSWQLQVKPSKEQKNSAN